MVAHRVHENSRRHGGAVLSGTKPLRILAIVTNYNEVYAQGYEIVRQDGELTVLRKRGH